MKKKSVDKFFLWIVIILVAIGVVMFTSASLGVLAKNPTKFYGIILGQFSLGLFGGFVALYFAILIPYKFWKKYSLFLFVASILLTLLVFIPSLSQSHGGAKRWVNIFGLSFQPVEFLKIGFIFYFASWLSWVKTKVQNIKYSIIPLIVLVGIIAFILLQQPDTKSLILIIVTALIMLFISGTPIKHILILFSICLVASFVLISFKPYLMDRVNTFFNPNHDALGSSYQLQQSLIAIGSGGLFGRGLGQSIQKFNYLPEPQGDSIFAVVGEELGFLGCLVIIAIYIAFALRGYRIAYRAPDSFGKILVTGIVTMITAQSFMNIASTIGVFPLTGVPLVFISHGGTSLFLSLGMVGIILNISRFQNKISLEK